MDTPPACSADKRTVNQGYNAPASPGAKGLGWSGQRTQGFRDGYRNNKGNMMIANKHLASTATMLALCFSHSAFADEFHYNNMLIGDRASGMGGAYTAVSDDATGLYYNPAGIVYVGDKNFSASVNAFYTQTKQFKNVIGGQPFERNSSALLANFFGIVKPFGDFKLGFSYAVPDAVSEDQNQTFDNVSASIQRHTINLSNRDSTYNFGPTIAAEVNGDLSLGLTLYGHKRDAQIILNQYQEVNTTDHWTNYYFRIHEYGLRPILGVAWSPMEKLSIGLAVSRTFILKSETTSQQTCWNTSSISDPMCPVSGLQRPKVSDSNIKRTYPTKLAVGAAYFVDRNLLISGDVTYYSAVQDPIYGEKVATVNVAIGTEYYLSKQWAIRAGFYTNMANTPDIVAGVTNIEEQINLYGLSLSVSNFSGSSSVTLGGTVNYGTGKSQISNDKSVQDANTLGWLLFLSSSY